MPSNKKFQKQKETQIQDFPLDEKLQALSDKDMYDLVQTLLDKNPEVRRSILEWFMDDSKMKNINRKQVSKALNEERLWENWYDAKPIISQFNEYGGGPEDEEEEDCDGHLDHIEELAEKGEISTEVKFEFMDELFEYYKAQNDYENAKRALLKAFKYVKAGGYIPEVRSYAHYNKMKQFLAKADWKEIEPKIIQDVREKDLEDYMRICLDKNMKKEVCKKRA